ncbi:MAG: hypothetical protein ACTSR8_13395 [Promethearchaeota archaeon]
MANINWEEFWTDFAYWFWTIPPFGQFLIVIGLVTLIALIITGVYYLVKGILYLIFYVLKGVYYLIKGIILGLYYISTGIYNAFTGKERSRKEVVVIKEVPVVETPKSELTAMKEVPIYCPDCGVKLTPRMVELIKSNEIAYCSFCGKGFKEGFIKIES